MISRQTFSEIKTTYAEGSKPAQRNFFQSVLPIALNTLHLFLFLLSSSLTYQA